MIFQHTLSTRITSSTIIAFVLMMGVVVPKSVRGDQNKKAVERTAKTSASQNNAFQDLIQEVKQNEKLYSDLQLWLTNVYEKLPKPTDIKKQIQTEALMSIDLQEKKFRLESITKGRRIIQTLVSPKKITSREVTGTGEAILVFDGNTVYHYLTDDWKSDKIEKHPRIKHWGKISDEIPALTNLARPHMFLCANGRPHVPLSTYLEGTRAVSAYPGSNASMQKMYFEKQILGTEKFQGLQCIKVRMELIDSNEKPLSRDEIWLAQDRNLIPVHRLHYHYRWSKEFPIDELTVDEWKELQPGVWFPMKAHSKSYNLTGKKSADKRELTSRRQYDVTSITLKPPHRAPDVFTKLDFPKGTFVRDFTGDKGKQLRIRAEKIKKYFDKARSQK